MRDRVAARAVVAHELALDDVGLCVCIGIIRRESVYRVEPTTTRALLQKEQSAATYVKDDAVDELEQLVFVREVLRDRVGEDRHVRVAQLQPKCKQVV